MIHFYTTEKQRTANSVLPQLAVTCKTEAERYSQTFVLGDSEALRNRQLRQHANRYMKIKSGRIRSIRSTDRGDFRQSVSIRRASTHLLSLETMFICSER